MIPNIFISSTIDDLRYLRDALRDAVVDLAYNPVMSEHGEVGYLHPMTAAESCYRSIAQCQVAVIIVGRRYGNPSEDGVSVTHKEFRTAREHGIPLIAFVESQVLNYKEVFKANPDPVTWKRFPHMDNPALTFALIDEITSSPSYNGLIPFINVADAKKALKLQIADFVGESLNEIIKPMRGELKDVLAEIKTLRHELAGTRQLDPDFQTALRYILNDRNTGYRYLTEHLVGPLDKAMPLLLRADDFDAFVIDAGYKLVIQEEFGLALEGRPRDGMIGGMEFAAPSEEEGKGFERAAFGIFKDKTLVMTESAKRHFDWLHHELKMQIGKQ